MFDVIDVILGFFAAVAIASITGVIVALLTIRCLVRELERRGADREKDPEQTDLANRADAARGSC